MSRKIPEFKQGNYYHIYNRGAYKRNIFFDDENYSFLLKRVKKYVSINSITVVAYCLMPNHYHFLLRQDGDTGVGRCIQSIFNSYTKAINKRYNRSGTLFEGPYRAIHVDNQHYLIHLCRYIHRNPLQAELVSHLENWPYSNFLEWIGKRNGTLYDREFVMNYFDTEQSYAKFVRDFKPNEKLKCYLFN